MKNQKLISIPLLALGLFAITFSSCKKSTPAPTALTLTSLKSGSVDLNGGATATGVDPTQPIVATFSTAIDASTATAANITMTNTTEATQTVTLNIAVSGSTITLTTSDFGPGTQYQLTFGSGLKASNAQAITSTARTFITAGAFAPPGAFASWNFDNNVLDQTGTLTADFTKDITYVTGRNANAGQAASFNGTTSLIEYPNATSLINTSDFTLSFWCNVDTVNHVDSLGNPKGFFAMGIGIYRGLQFEIDGGNGSEVGNCKMAASYNLDTVVANTDLWADCTGNLGWQGWTYSKDLTASGGLKALIAGKWGHIVCTYDAATKIGSVYINGTLIKTQDFNLWPAGDIFTGCQGLEFNTTAGAGTGWVFGFAEDRTNAIGDGNSWGTYNSVGSNHYQGFLDDVRIYHKALTAAEVTLMYNSGK